MSGTISADLLRTHLIRKGVPPDTVEVVAGYMLMYLDGRFLKMWDGQTRCATCGQPLKDFDA